MQTQDYVQNNKKKDQSKKLRVLKSKMSLFDLLQRMVCLRAMIIQSDTGNRFIMTEIFEGFVPNFRTVLLRYHLIIPICAVVVLFFTRRVSTNTCVQWNVVGWKIKNRNWFIWNHSINVIERVLTRKLIHR